VAPVPVAVSATQLTPADPLFQTLSSLPRDEAPLSALPEDLLAGLRARAASLPEEVRAALLDPDDPAVAGRPLLHLAAGGGALAAYAALCSTPAPGHELLDLRLPGGKVDDLSAIVNRVSQLAAKHLLRERALDFDAGRPRALAALSQVVVAARALEQRDLELLALLELVTREPTASRRLQLAALHLQRLEVSEAEEILATPELASHGELPALQRQLDAARRLKAIPIRRPGDVDEAVQIARAQLTLGADRSALAALAPFADSWGHHLAYSTALTRAQAGSTGCPHVNPGLGNAVLCAAGWARLGHERDPSQLDRAWQSGTGRDAQAAEEYLGIRRVVPMTYGLVGPVPFTTAQGLLEAVSGLEQDAAMAVPLAPHFKAISVLSRALRAALQAAQATPHGERPRLAPEVRAELLSVASRVHSELGQTAWGQAAVLGVVAVVTQEEDASPLLRALAPSIVDEHLATLSGLTLWHALASGDAAVLKQSEGLLARLVQYTDPSSFERSKWLLLWAEASAHLEPEPRASGTLEALAGRLLTEPVPPDLRLRAALDIAGLRARRQDFSGGVAVLDRVLATTPQSAAASRLERELWVAATGYRVVLRGLASGGAELSESANQLDDLLVDANQDVAFPPTLRLWLASWRGEVSHLLRMRMCADRRSCEQRAEAVRGLKKADLQLAVGVRTAELLARGVLVMGGVEIQFRYHPDGYVMPLLQMDSLFLLPHAPNLNR
jgi:hypothetical protein